jgi:hypothetical protein
MSREAHIPAPPKAPRTSLPSAASCGATITATVMFALFYLNYVYGWITADMLDWSGMSRGV